MNAYVIGNEDKPLPVPEGEGSFVVLRQAMGIIGRVKGGEVPKNTTTQIVPLFTVIAQDRDAAKALLCAKLDEMFDVFEEDEK